MTAEKRIEPSSISVKIKGSVDLGLGIKKSVGLGFPDPNSSSDSFVFEEGRFYENKEAPEVVYENLAIFRSEFKECFIKKLINYENSLTTKSSLEEEVQAMNKLLFQKALGPISFDGPNIPDAFEMICDLDGIRIHKKSRQQKKAKNVKQLVDERIKKRANEEKFFSLKKAENVKKLVEEKREEKREENFFSFWQARLEGLAFEVSRVYAYQILTRTHKSLVVEMVENAVNRVMDYLASSEVKDEQNKSFDELCFLGISRRKASSDTAKKLDNAKGKKGWHTDFVYRKPMIVVRKNDFSTQDYYRDSGGMSNSAFKKYGFRELFCYYDSEKKTYLQETLSKEGEKSPWIKVDDPRKVLNEDMLQFIPPYLAVTFADLEAYSQIIPSKIELKQKQKVKSFNQFIAERYDLTFSEGFPQAIFRGIDLYERKVSLKGGNFSKTIWLHCNLSEKDLTDTFFRKSSFLYCQFKGANFTRTQLKGAKLLFADLREIYCVGEEGPDLKEANLSYSNVKGVNLATMDFTQVGSTVGVNFDEAKIITDQKQTENLKNLWYLNTLEGKANEDFERFEKFMKTIPPDNAKTYGVLTKHPLAEAYFDGAKVIPFKVELKGQLQGSGNTKFNTTLSGFSDARGVHVSLPEQLNISGRVRLNIGVPSPSVSSHFPSPLSQKRISGKIAAAIDQYTDALQGSSRFIPPKTVLIEQTQTYEIKAMNDVHLINVILSKLYSQEQRFFSLKLYETIIDKTNFSLEDFRLYIKLLGELGRLGELERFEEVEFFSLSLYLPDLDFDKIPAESVEKYLDNLGKLGRLGKLGEPGRFKKLKQFSLLLHLPDLELSKVTRKNVGKCLERLGEIGALGGFKRTEQVKDFSLSVHLPDIDLEKISIDSIEKYLGRLGMLGAFGKGEKFGNFFMSLCLPNMNLSKPYEMPVVYTEIFKNLQDFREVKSKKFSTLWECNIKPRALIPVSQKSLELESPKNNVGKFFPHDKDQKISDTLLKDSQKINKSSIFAELSTSIKLADSVEIYKTAEGRSFESHEVKNDGNYGYTVFGIERDEAYKLLQKNLTKIHHLLISVIQEELLRKNFIDHLVKYRIANSGLLSLFKEYELSVTKGFDIDAAESKIFAYAHDLNVVTGYLNYDVKDKQIGAGWSHPCLLQALAHIRGIGLCIWVKANDQLIPHKFYHQYIPQGATETRHLLFFNGNQFQHLIESVPQKNEKNDLEKVEMDSSVAGLVSERRIVDQYQRVRGLILKLKQEQGDNKARTEALLYYELYELHMMIAPNVEDREEESYTFELTKNFTLKF